MTITIRRGKNLICLPSNLAVENQRWQTYRLTQKAFQLALGFADFLKKGFNHLFWTASLCDSQVRPVWAGVFKQTVQTCLGWLRNCDKTRSVSKPGLTMCARHWKTSRTLIQWSVRRINTAT